jgi:UPF0755 protein
MSFFKKILTGIIVITAGIVVALSIHVYNITRVVPVDFPIGKTFIIEEDESLRSISVRLEKDHYISSALLFRLWVSSIGGDRHVQLGGYFFDKPYVLGAIVKKLTSGKSDMPLVSVTIPEGSTSYEVATLIKKVLPNFSIDIFGEKVFAQNADGRLFPSTYFLLPSTTEERIVSIMTNTFEKKYAEEFKGATLPQPLKNREEIISLAAILEGEAKTPEDMQIVAGILLKRLDKNMALQVDVAPETYKTKGLPITIINNPGIVAMHAVFNPISTDYLFYLTGKDGTMHYAKTFTEHKQNIKKYLK